MNTYSGSSLDADFVHMFGPGEHVKAGVRMRPSAIVDGKILVAGRVPWVKELKKLLFPMGLPAQKEEAGWT